jgi:ADP-ribose pyrophosphatase YjhB (NUDIX family)
MEKSLELLLLHRLNADSAEDAIKKLESVPYIPYPVRLSTVDGIITSGSSVLLAKKPNASFFRFPGGFVDTGETTIEAVKREMNEEVNLPLNVDTQHGRPLFLFEVPVDDPRYRESPHKIVTSVYWFCNPDTDIKKLKPMDDIAHLEWFNVSDVKIESIEPFHQRIFQEFSAYFAFAK